MSTDPDHRFELSISLDKLEIALAMATELDSEQKWKQLGDKALAKGSFAIAEECFDRAGDLNTLLLIFTYGVFMSSPCLMLDQVVGPRRQAQGSGREGSEIGSQQRRHHLLHQPRNGSVVSALYLLTILSFCRETPTSASMFCWAPVESPRQPSSPAPMRQATSQPS